MKGPLFTEPAPFPQFSFLYSYTHKGQSGQVLVVISASSADKCGQSCPNCVCVNEGWLTAEAATSREMR